MKIQLNAWKIVKGAIIGVLLVAMIVILANTCRQTLIKQARVEYEGKIIDKWAGYHESSRGASPYFRLRIEDGNGAQSTVSVEHADYLRSEIGMWIRRDERGVRFASKPGDFELENR